MMHRRGPRWAAIFLLLAQPACATGNALPSLEETLLQAETLLATEPQDPQLHFIRGMALSSLGRQREAADEFRWMLVRDPSLLRPRLELGRVQMRLGQYDSARYNFEQVLANDLPEEVRKNILNLLARIRESTTTFTLAFELLSDSNPRQATSAREVEIQGLHYTLNGDSKARASSGARLSFEGRVPLSESSLWFFRSSGEMQEYTEHRMNFQYLQAAAGRHFHFDEQTLTLEAGAHASTFGDRPLYSGLLFAVTDYRQLRQDIGIKLTLNSQQLDYHNDFPQLSGWQYGASLQGFYAPSTFTRWETSLGILRNLAKEAPYAFQQANASMRYVHEWVGGWITGEGVYFGISAYDEADPLFGEKRHDFEKRLEFELSNRRLRIGTLTPRLQLGWVDHASNIDLYSYKRGYARIGMTGDF